MTANADSKHVEAVEVTPVKWSYRRWRSARRTHDLGSIVRVALDTVADVALAQTGLPVTKQSVGSSTRFSIEAASPGLPVVVAHEHETHLWLEAGDGWVTHDLTPDVEQLFDLWKDLLSLANRIALGSEAPPNATVGVWTMTDGTELSRPVVDEWAWRGDHAHADV